jgi:hypothetical protein
LFSGENLQQMDEVWRLDSSALTASQQEAPAHGPEPSRRQSPTTNAIYNAIGTNLNASLCIDCCDRYEFLSLICGHKSTARFCVPVFCGHK